MQVEEERVTGRQRHTKQDSEDGEEVGEKREAVEMGEGSLGLGLNRCSWVDCLLKEHVSSSFE